MIALHLRRRAREGGNSVFIDKALHPYDDQWAFLSSLRRFAADTATRIVAEAKEPVRGRCKVRPRR